MLLMTYELFGAYNVGSPVVSYSISMVIIVMSEAKWLYKNNQLFFVTQSLQTLVNLFTELLEEFGKIGVDPCQAQPSQPSLQFVEINELKFAVTRY